VFVALEGAYHGDTFGAMSVGEREPFFRAFEPLLFDVRHAAANAGAIAAALSELGARAAGVILEPRVQGAAGMLMHGDELVRDVRALCDRAGVPMIADEVMVGFGRTGSLFACEGAGVAPDLMCLAKGLTGGTFPLSATLVTEELFGAFLSDDRRKTFFHGHSFTANPVGCALGVASMRLCREDDVPAKLDALGARIEARLDHPHVRRRGGIVALDLDVPEGGDGYLASTSQRLRERAIERGVLLRPLGNTLYAMPPACTDMAQSDRIAEVMMELAAEPAT
jgi:adenosylmethionine-8-amino-7-oxononanoate aminotransferase